MKINILSKSKNDDKTIVSICGSMDSSDIDEVHYADITNKDDINDLALYGLCKIKKVNSDDWLYAFEAEVRRCV